MRIKTHNLIEGQKGESKAVDYLKSIGYKILERNYKSLIGEIDIVALDNDRYVFVEVKTRTTGVKGLGREVVNAHKLRMIKNSALSYLKYNRIDNPKMRFDIVEITGDNINHIQAVC